MPEHDVLPCLEKCRVIIIYHQLCNKQNNKSEKNLANTQNNNASS